VFLTISLPIRLATCVKLCSIAGMHIEPGMEIFLVAGEVIRLNAAGWSADILPETGGAIASLCHEGQPVLRSAGPDVDDVLDCASFSMIPFANRIGNADLRFGDQVLPLVPDPAALPHALHGHGWRVVWAVKRVTPSEVVLAIDHAGHDARNSSWWPWAYHAEQRITIGPGGLSIALAVTNRDPDANMPCGTGIHPYFARRPDSAIQAAATTMWASRADGLAIEQVRSDIFSSGQGVPVTQIEGLDNYFPCAGPVTVLGGDRPIMVGGDGMAGVHIYVPRGQDYFCVEPVSHAPNAFGRGEYGAADIIAPGATKRWRWGISSSEDGSSRSSGSDKDPQLSE
jgi:aldose 1-epimerase